MPYTLPPIEKLQALIQTMEGGGRSKKQRAVAEQVVEEYNNLLKFTKSLTQLLNSQESPDEEVY